MTSICLIQSEVTELNSRKTTKRNSELFPSCLTQEVGSVTRSQRASVLSSTLHLEVTWVIDNKKTPLCAPFFYISFSYYD
ncbi:hypothetical protein E5A76_19740 [Photobacterium sp. CAIM 1937]|nr:hypothetical protein [Photobacterium lucens]MZG82061.1 hypothetical protein [Photobacterium lucens]